MNVPFLFGLVLALLANQLSRNAGAATGAATNAGGGSPEPPLDPLPSGTSSPSVGAYRSPGPLHLSPPRPTYHALPGPGNPWRP